MGKAARAKRKRRVARGQAPSPSERRASWGLVAAVGALGQLFDVWGVRLTKRWLGGYCAGTAQTS